MVKTIATVLREKSLKKTRVIFIIDGSGSMSSKATDVREGFNAYVNELKGKTGITLSAVVFNTKVFLLFKDLTLSKVPKLTSSNYAPGGNTALYDAIGEALDDEKNESIKDVVRRQTQYIVVIMTDGQENSSRMYGKADIRGKITRREGKGNWTFVYLGEDQDSWGEAHGIGINVSQTYGGTVPTLATWLDMAGSTYSAHATASSGGSMRSYGSHFAATNTAKSSRTTNPIPNNATTNSVGISYNPTKKSDK